MISNQFCPICGKRIYWDEAIDLIVYMPGEVEARIYKVIRLHEHCYEKKISPLLEGEQ